MINIKRILCPTDLSPHSGNAVRYALALSRAHEAELILLHCTDDVDGEEKLASVCVGTHRSFRLRWRLVVAPADDIDEEIMTQAQVEERRFDSDAVEASSTSCGSVGFHGRVSLPKRSVSGACHAHRRARVCKR